MNFYQLADLICREYIRTEHVYELEGDKFSVNVYSFDDTVKAGIYEDLYIDFSSIDLA